MKETLPVIPSAVEKKASQKTYIIPAVLLRCSGRSRPNFNILADLVVGHIILDIQSDKRVGLPDLRQFSSNELKVLHAAVGLGSFSLENLAASSELDPAMTRHFFGYLLKRGFFTYSSGKYSVNGCFNIIFSPEKLSFNGEVVSKEVNFDVKLEPRIKPQDLKNQLSRYVDIKGITECWIEYHRTEK